MGVFNLFKRSKTQDKSTATVKETSALPTPETMFALNHSAMQMIKDKDYARHGFESQLDLVAAFTIVEILGASGGKMSDDEIVEVISPQFDILPERCSFLIGQARKTNV